MLSKPRASHRQRLFPHRPCPP